MNVNVKLDTVESQDDSEVSRRVYATTKGGKEIVAYSDRQGYIRVKFTTGGELPVILAGRFMKYTDAYDAIDAYITQEPASKVKEDKEVSFNGKSRPESNIQ